MCNPSESSHRFHQCGNDFFLRCLEFRSRTGAVEKNRVRNPVRHDFFIQQIEGKFNANSGETGRQVLPAIEASRDDVPNLVFLQPLRIQY